MNIPRHNYWHRCFVLAYGPQPTVDDSDTAREVEAAEKKKKDLEQKIKENTEQQKKLKAKAKSKQASKK